MNFDEIIDRRGTNCAKWDGMNAVTGVSAPDAIPMWIADMDFRAADVLQDAVAGLMDKANYGYFTGEGDLNKTISWWMQERHGWTIEPSWISNTYGLGNGIGICLQAFTQPGDEVIIFTPVYHEFLTKIAKAGRTAKQWEMPVENGVYHLNLAGLEEQMTGRERVLLFCSPHNPAGRIWTADELKQVAAFCERHELILISDDIHHDLIYPGQTYTPLLAAAPEAASRTIMLTSASKTFNIAGARLGSVTIPDPDLRQRFRDVLNALDIKPNLLGLVLTQAAYSPRGAAWVDELVQYLDDNHRLFLEGTHAIPGLTPMPMQSTYLAWVDFANTGMGMDEVIKRIKTGARIAPTIGADLGRGGESYLRFNIATPRPRLQEAIDRLQAAFADLQ